MIANKTSALFLILSLCFPAVGRMEVEQLADRPERVSVRSLELPPFSIFISRLWDNPVEIERILRESELEAFLQQVAEDRSKGRSGEQDYLWVVPMIFHRSRGLFTKNSWSNEEITQGKLMSLFLSRLADKPELTIRTTNDEEAFGKGLVRLRDWFVSLCQDNQTLARMIFTLDSGPYFGTEAGPLSLSKEGVIGTLPIPKKAASFVLAMHGDQQGPLIVGVASEGEPVRWLRRLGGSSIAEMTNAKVRIADVLRLEGYGWAVDLVAQAPSTDKRCRIYLDESLNFRFYYLSW